MAKSKKITLKKISSVIIILLVAGLSTYLDKGKLKQSINDKPNRETIQYTKHARCRMGCRFVSKKEVQEVIQGGRINQRKSNPQARPCPVVAREKKTTDNQRVRVVYGKCSGKIKIITVIDLDTDHRCKCV